MQCVTEPLRVEFSGAYALNRLERTIATLEPLLHLDEPREIVVDFSRLVHFGPTSLALVTAAMKRLSDEGLYLAGSQMVAPRSPPVRRYLERMNLIREVVGIEMPEEFIRKESRGFRPCEHFDTDENYWRVASSLAAALGEQCKVDESAQGAIHVCLDEICENVIHHADTSMGGFAAAQGWTRKTNRQFEIAIVDLGVGIRTSLTKNPDYAHITEDCKAIETALKPRVTSTPERNAGIGLFITGLVLAFNGGHLLARSGSGAVIRGTSPRVETRAATLPGTVIVIRANIDRPLDLEPVYRALDEFDKRHKSRKDQPDDADHRDDELQAR